MAVKVNIGKNQASLLKSGFLRKQVTQQREIEAIQSGLELVFKKYADQLIKDLKDNLKKSGKNASSALSQSISPKFIFDTNVATFELRMEDYYKFVDKGVKGSKQDRAPQSPFKYTKKQPPIDVIEKWMGQKKGVALKFKKGESKEDVAYRMAARIKTRGVKPSYFFRDALKKNPLIALKSDIRKELGRGIQIFIVGEILQNAPKK